MSLRFYRYKYTSDKSCLSIDDWNIEDRSWFLFCNQDTNLDTLWKALELSSTHTIQGICGDTGRVALVSLSEQQKLLELELETEETDFTNELDPGTSVEDLIQKHVVNPEFKSENLAYQNASSLEQVLAQFDLLELRSRGFRLLSTGETRRLMLAIAIVQRPQLLLLDDPFAGLDRQHRAAVSEIITKLSESIQIIVASSREEDLCAGIDAIAHFGDSKLLRCQTRQQWLNDPLREHLSALAKVSANKVAALFDSNKPKAAKDPLFVLRDGSVSYQGEYLFKKVDWQINPGEHWQVVGPNGCGKSTLLQYINGDHPQCYANDIQVLGFKRGQGETIWQVKRHIGLVSSALHLAYRVNIKAFEVVLSGLFDSIGLYQSYGEGQRQSAQLCLDLVGMSEHSDSPFRELSYGQQRIVLILRALIKQPRLLLLDEPCQGLDFLNRKLVLAALELIGTQNHCQLVYVSHYSEDRLNCIGNILEFKKTDFGYYQATLSGAGQ